MGGCRGQRPPVKRKKRSYGHKALIRLELTKPVDELVVDETFQSHELTASCYHDSLVSTKFNFGDFF